MPKIYTIGTNGKNKEIFAEILNAVDVNTVIDVRLWRQSRFVPWTSGTNLQRMLGDKYKYIPELTPTLDLLTKIKNSTINWAEYEQIFNDILKKRQIENLFTPNTINKVCFLCAEKTAENCHRRLVAEYLQQHFPDIEIVHL